MFPPTSLKLVLSVFKIPKILGKKPTFEKATLKKGRTYLLKKKQKWDGVEIAGRMMPLASSTVFVTPAQPEEIPKKYDLTNVKFFRCCPDNLMDVVSKLEVFLKTDGGLIVVDDFYAMTNGLPPEHAASLLSKLSGTVMTGGSTLVLSFEEKEGKSTKDLEHALATSYLDAMLDAFSNPIRKQILDHVKKNGNSSFTAIMEALGFKDIPPKLSFHLNVLKNSGILTQDDKKAYCLTEYGEMLIDLSERFKKMVLDGTAELEQD